MLCLDNLLFDLTTLGSGLELGVLCIRLNFNLSVSIKGVLNLPISDQKLDTRVTHDLANN